VAPCCHVRSPSTRCACSTAPRCRARSPPTRGSKLSFNIAADALCSLDGKLLCPAAHDALCLFDCPLLLCLIAADALRLLDGSKLSCLAAADVLCLLDGS